MTEAHREKLHKYIDQMSEIQLRIVLGFVRKLFNLSD